MKETNLTPSPRLKGRCCLTDYLYSKATLMLLIFMLPLVGMAQEKNSQEYIKAKEANHQEYLQSIYGNKPDALQQVTIDRKKRQLSEAEKLQQEEELQSQNLRAKLERAGVNVQKELDAGFTLQQLFDEIDTPATPAGYSDILMRGEACADAEVLPCDTPIIDNTFGSAFSSVPSCGGFSNNEGNWYIINGNGATNVVSVTASDFTAQLKVYSSGDGTCGDLQCAGGTAGQGTSTVTFFAAFEEPYWIFISGLSTQEGNYTIQRTSSGECFDGPSGDGLSPETGFELVCNDVQTIDTTGFPSSSIGGTCGTTSNSTPAVWYRYTAVPGSQETIAIRTCGGDSKLQVFSTPTGGCIDGNDDDSWTGCSSFGESEVNFTAQINETYYIKLFSFSGSGATYDIEVLCSGDVVTPPPSAPNNDLCPDALELVCNETTEGTLIAATSTGAPTFFCGTSINTAGVWYYYEGQGDNVIVNTCGTDTKLNVYTGSCGSFTCVGGNDDTSVPGCTSFNESQVAFDAEDGEIYYIYVSAFSSSSIDDFEITLTCPDPIVNDECEDAIALECGDIETGSTVGASTASIPFCDTGLTTAPGVWYSHIGTGDLLTVSLRGSSYDTKLGIFTGGCDGLTCVAGDDDASDPFALQSEIRSLPTVAGQEYLIYVTGFSSNAGTYNIELTCQPDPCNIAETIACGETATGTTTGGSTAGPTDTCGTSPGATGVYYKYVGTDEFVTASLCNSSYDTKINVYQGACGALTCVGGNDDSCGSRSEFTWYAGVGEEYYIWVSGFGTATGDYELTMTCQDPEPNDLCGDALALSCDVTVSGSTILSTDRDKPESDCDGTFGTTNGAGVWYTITGTGGDIIASTCSENSFDTKIVVLTGECGNLTCYTGNDDGPGCPNFSSEVQFATEAGVTYYLYITGWTGFSGTSEATQGDFELTIDCLCAPSQDGPECVTIYDGYDDPNYSSATLTGVLDYANEPVSYAWSTGETTESITVDAADGSQNYSVTMTDVDGCSGTQEFFVYVMDVNCDTRGTDKVEICHNGQTICVAPSAVQSHLNHGDVLGACGNSLCDALAPFCDLVISSPADGSTGETISPTVEWSEASGLVDGYNVSISDANGVVFSADAGDALSLVVTGLEYSTAYTVSVTPYNSNGDALGCSPNSFTTQAEPNGDGFTPQTALPLSCGVQGSGATPDPNGDDSAASFCGTSSGIANGAWFTFTGTGGTIDVNTVGSFADTKLQVYSSTDGGNSLSCVGGNDDISFPGTLQSRVIVNSTSGLQYYAYVSSYDSSSFPSGPFVLNVDCTGARSASSITKDSADWMMSPNPTRGNVTLNLGKYLNENVTVEVLDFSGIPVKTMKLNVSDSEDYNVQLNRGLRAGIYFVRVTSGMRTSTKKLMIMN